jgi:hypothetical protein
MLERFFTKPLQGSLFTKFRDVILGYKHAITLANDSSTPPEERVGNIQAGERKTRTTVNIDAGNSTRNESGIKNT